jgi:hypothetical protein
LSDATGNIVGTTAAPIDPRLGPAQNNGGPVPAIRLRAGSPALDAGNPAAPGSDATACEPVDARGVERPHGTACDIGAYEHAGAIEGTVTFTGGAIAANAFVELVRTSDGQVIGTGYTNASGPNAIGITGEAANLIVRAHSPADSAVVRDQNVLASPDQRITINLVLP